MNSTTVSLKLTIEELKSRSLPDTLLPPRAGFLLATEKYSKKDQGLQHKYPSLASMSALRTRGSN